LALPSSPISLRRYLRLELGNCRLAILATLDGRQQSHDGMP